MRGSRAAAALLTCLILSSPIPAISQPTAPRFDKIILITWDGVRPLWVDVFSRNASLPNLNRLRTEGHMIFLHIVDHSSSTEPGFAVMETGYGPSITGVTANTFSGRILEQKKIIQPELTTFARLKAVYGASWHTALILPWSQAIINVTNTVSTIFWKTRPFIDYWFSSENVTWSRSQPDYSRFAFGYEAEAGAGLIKAGYLAERAADFIRANAAGRFYLRMHFVEPDAAGHTFAESLGDRVEPHYFNALKEDDEALGKVIAALEQSGIYSQTAVLVSTDHGFSGAGHGGVKPFDDPEVTRSFLIFNRREFYKGVDEGIQNDLAPTILALAGIEPDSLTPRYAETSKAVPIFRYDVAGRDLKPPEILDVRWASVGDGRINITIRVREESGILAVRVHYTGRPGVPLEATVRISQREGSTYTYTALTLPLQALGVDTTHFHVEVYDNSLLINGARYPSSGSVEARVKLPPLQPAGTESPTINALFIVAGAAAIGLASILIVRRRLGHS